MVITTDVAAVDARGRAIGGLGPADFELTVDGAPQPLETITRIDAARQRRPRAFAIVLDEYHTRALDAEALRTALTRFVDVNLTPDDQVIVMKPLDSLLAIPIAKDLGEVRAAIASFAGRDGDYQPRNAFERDFMGRSPEAIEHLRRQVMVSALNALAIRLGGLGEGRKALLLVSDGFAATRPARGEEALPTIDTLVRAATRENVAIYTLAPSDEPAGRDVLRSLTSTTDGRPVENGPALDAGLEQIAADSSDYYLLTFRPAVVPDGRFHVVSVRVKRPGARVRARTGFWAMVPDEALRLDDPAARALETPFERTPRHISTVIRPWFGMARAADGKTRVTIVWEPSRRVPGAATRTVAPVQIAVTATAPDGSTLYQGTLRPTGALGESSDGDAKAVFDAVPGRLLLHMSITGANAKEIDVDTRDLSIRDLRQPVAIGTPQILRARSAREFRTLAADPDAAPVAAREFSRAERLLVRFAAYSPPDDPVATSARLISRAGRTMGTYTPAQVPDAPAVSQFDVPLAAFAPGEYTIEVAAQAHAGSAKEVVTFRVTG